MSTLRKRKTKNGFVYVIDFIYEGRRIVRTTKTDDRKVAEQILDDIRGKIARGSFGLTEVTKKSVLLRDYFHEYFDNVKSEKKADTIKNEMAYSESFTAFIGNCNIDSIDLRMLKHWKSHMLTREKRNGGHISPATFNIHRRFLKAAFNEAIKYGYLQENPFKELKEAKVDEKRVHLLDSEIDNVLQLIDADILRIKASYQQSFLKRFRILVEFLLNTGLRKSEALNLEWKDIDLDNRVIHIEKTKTSRTRIIPLNDTAHSCLVEIGENIFHGFDSHHVSRKFHSYIKRLGLSGLKLHSLRHTFATNLSELGEDTSVIQKLLGHQDIRTTQVYAKANLKRLRAAVNKLSDISDEKKNEPTESKIVAEMKNLYAIQRDTAA